MNADAHPVSLERGPGYWLGRFTAMASPCEMLIETNDEHLAARLASIAAREARRIEHKFSRYRRDSVLSLINVSRGKPIEVDAETANLLDYAAQCFTLSDGRFDVTSGVLREVWHFDGSANIPSADAVARVHTRVGWQKLDWRRPTLVLPEGMEIDLGGIGKEYAVDRVVQLLRAETAVSIVVNFGGDLAVTAPRAGGVAWQVGVEDPRRVGNNIGQLALVSGALATSGDARRYLLHDGVRYGHILDPRTGWPVQGGPRSVTVAAGTCMEAGMLATFAILHGAEAQRFLDEQEVRYWLA